MFTVTIRTGNAAFEDAGKEREIARILRELADALEIGITTPFTLFDMNGNSVGIAKDA